jgi:hypothetical protein
MGEIDERKKFYGLVYAFKIVRSQTKKTCNIKAGIENVGI